MGNYKFRLSDMIPNAWFYKLKDNMSRTRNHHNTSKRLPSSSTAKATTFSAHQHYSQPRNSIYYTPRLEHIYPSHEPPRKSSRRSRKTTRKSIYKPSSPKTKQPSLGTSRSSSSMRRHFSSSSSSEFEQNQNEPCRSCKLSSSTKDIIIDVCEKTQTKKIMSVPEIEIELTPILTKPEKSPPLTKPKRSSNTTKLENKTEHSEYRSPSTATKPRKSVSYSGVKLRPNSPKLASSNKKLHMSKRKSFSESLAVVKSSFDPQKDFRESMLEMIVENNLRASKDLEELLACYLTLNSNEYHDLIVKAFEQIWFSLPNS